MTDPANPVEINPFYLDGSRGRLFCIAYRPRAALGSRTGILIIPPFAEEMNKVRRQTALQARMLATLGYTVLSVDLYGTGDSEGDFADARWDIWCDDLAAGARWLATQDAESLVLWGTRLGALLAAELIDNVAPPVARLLLWQPSVDGRVFLNQFLRLRIAADMLAGEQQETTRDLLDQIERGDSVEIAGYHLHPKLAASMAEARLDSLTAERLPDLVWFEIVGAAEKPAPVAARKLQDKWRDAGVRLHAETVVGEPFWTTPEITVVPQLIDRTCACLAGIVE